MTFSDLLRLTVLLAGRGDGARHGHGDRGPGDSDTTTLIVAAAWWTIAAVGGLMLGRSARAAEAVREVFAGARTTPTLPTATPAGPRSAGSGRWPLRGVVGGVGFVFPGVAAVGAGYAIFVALAWRRREAAVTAVEERDGVRFYVEPGSALTPLPLSAPLVWAATATPPDIRRRPRPPPRRSVLWKRAPSRAKSRRRRRRAIRAAAAPASASPRSASTS